MTITPDDNEPGPLSPIENLSAWLIIGGAFILFMVGCLAVLGYHLIERIP